VVSAFMSTVTKRDLDQRTTEVLAQATEVGEVIVTERGEPRWRVSSYRGQDGALARAERQGRYTPPASKRAPWPEAVGAPRYESERLRLQGWMDAPDTDFISSRLLRTEVVRVLRRDGRPLSDAEPLLDRVGLFDITRETHTVAESDRAACHGTRCPASCYCLVDRRIGDGRDS